MGTTAEQPLKNIEEWDDFVAGRYKEGREESEFRNYDEQANPGVAEFYRLNHANQTLAFVLEKEKEFGALKRGKKSIWEAADYLNTLIDDSDPDTDLSQIEHLMQTAEAIRKDGHPRWFVLTGFLHDLGKVLCLYGESQWAVVGELFPSDAPIRTRSSFPATSSRTPTFVSRNTRLSTASTSRTAAWARCTSLGGMTNTFTASRGTICPSRRNTCSATTPSIPPTGMAHIAT